MAVQLVVGFLLSVVIVLVAKAGNMLTWSGALAAVIIGGLIFGFGGLSWALLLVIFFVSSSLLSRLVSHRKETEGDKYAKGSSRDWGQVLANGGIGVVLVIFYAIFNQDLPGDELFASRFISIICWLAYAGSISAVTADTWATELGVLDRENPRVITSGRRVEKGSSGAISPLGIIASLLGALLIGIVTALLTFFSEINEVDNFLIIIAVSLGGLFASLFDSFLGATLQAIYFCPGCEKETEQFPQHVCGTPTSIVRGLDWLNNDFVNFFAALLGSAIAIGIWILL